MNLPNGITIARIALVPVFVVLAYGESNAAAAAAAVVFVVASVSDLIDGYLARRHGTESRAGKFLDPLADKLLVGAALVVLVDAHAFPLWAAVVIAVREVAVQILRIQVVHSGADLPASPSAKAKTLTQLAMVGWWLLPWSERNAGHWLLLALAVGVTVWSGAEYFVQAFRPRVAVER
ncbi:MAG: CDP-diacylglycerol--glycerol-3-phosphate 3-phosphatidyltransferase [Actinomycetota bacterium]|nr:CDP-diacylglycerol--glycerol-3-phosphate 3-phosphatidyltransferase [Actinomycetota bacterium]